MRLILFLLAAIISATPASRAADNNDLPPLRVGVSPIFPPMVYKQGRELVGVEVDLARAFGEHIGREVVFVEVPWKDQIERLNDGKTDIIMSSMSNTGARRFLVSFTEPYLKVGQMALVRREDVNKYALGFSLNTPEKVGVIKATVGEYLVERDFPKISRKSYKSGTDAAQALMKGKVDMFISDSTLIWHLAAVHSNDGLSVVRLVLSEEAVSWAVRRSDDALLESANAFIARSKEDGRLRTTFRRWTAIGE